MDLWSSSDFIAGWAGGVAGLVVGHPADTVKVRQQTFNKSGGPLKIVRTALQYEGIPGLYKGLSFPLISAGCLNALFFGVYGNTLRYLEQEQVGNSEPEKDSDPGHKPIRQAWYPDVFLAGCVGGLAASFLACPVDMIKIQMQAQTGISTTWRLQSKHRHTGVINCVRNLHKSHGIRAFYTGASPMLLRDVASYGVYMVIYESGVRTSSWNHIVTTIVSGGTAGAVSWALITPIDVVKSRIQADNISNPTYKGVLDCITKSYREQGLSVFFRGFWMMMLRSFPVNAATFLVYEWCLMVLDPHKHKAKSVAPEKHLLTRGTDY